MSTGPLAGKRVVVVGAAGELGSALLREFLRCDAQVLAVDAESEALQAAVAAFGGHPQLSARACDVTTAAGAARALAEAPDVLVCAPAAEGSVGSVAEAPAEQLEGALRGSVLRVWHCLRAALPAMLARGAGSLVVVAAAAGLGPGPGQAALAAAHAALLSLVGSVAAELRGTGVGIRAVAPVSLLTGAELLAAPRADDERVSPDDVANLVRALAIDESGTLNGVVIPLRRG